MPRAFSTDDSLVETTKSWWDRLAAAEDWESAAELGKLCARKRSDLSYGWENQAWALHKLGRTPEAYNLLAPLLKGLKLPGPPSGRAAYCLACFSAALKRQAEATRWLKLACTLAVDKEALRLHAIMEPDLRSVWPGIPEFQENAAAILE